MVEAKYKILKILKPNKSRFKQMSYIEKLLQGATVQWKTLGEVAVKIYSGGTPNTSVEAYYGGGNSLVANPRSWYW